LNAAKKWQAFGSRDVPDTLFMPRLTLDGEPVPLQGGPETLADLLEIADTRCADGGRIVTAVRLDGVDEPAFREPQVVARPAATFAQVDVESGTVAALALSCLAEAGTALKSLADAGTDVAWRLRAGDIKTGNRDLGTITQGMATVLTITGAASLGLGVDLGALTTAHGSLSGIAERAARELDAIITAQMASDWPAVAARLEADLVPILRSWGDICLNLDLGAGAAAGESRVG
jgi:hypothetical protein